MATRTLRSLVTVALVVIGAAALLPSGGAAAAPGSTGGGGSGDAQPIFVEAPGGPIQLGEAPNSLVGEDENEGFTGGEGFGSVLVGYDGHRGSEILWNTLTGLYRVGSYHAPPGPGVVTGASDTFGVIDAPRRLVRIYEGSSSRYAHRQTLRTGVEPVAVLTGAFSSYAAILNRGSAELWAYDNAEGRRLRPVAKVPIGGKPTDVVTFDLFVRPVFISNAATDSVTELVDLEDGSYKVDRTIHVGKDPVALALGDFVRNGGDEFEVAVANRGSDTVTILEGQPGEDFTYPFRAIGTYPAGDEPVAVHAVDIDGKDGQDLAVADAGSDRLTILLNDGHGHFHRAGSYPTGRDPVAVAPIAFDRHFKPDLVVANHGSDSLTVLLRHEPALCAGREARPITGTADADLLTGRGDPDLIRGLGGDDKIFGNRAGDCIYGGGGDDYLLGGEGGDLIDGGPGDDRIYGGPPQFYPRLGRDTIIGGPGRDRIHAGALDDIVRAADGERDLVDCGPGIDTAFVDRRDRVVECEHVQVIAPPGHQ